MTAQSPATIPQQSIKVSPFNMWCWKTFVTFILIVFSAISNTLAGVLIANFLLLGVNLRLLVSATLILRSLHNIFPIKSELCVTNTDFFNFPFQAPLLPSRLAVEEVLQWKVYIWSILRAIIRKNKYFFVFYKAISYLDLPHGLSHFGESRNAVTAANNVIAVEPHVGLLANLALKYKFL